MTHLIHKTGDIFTTEAIAIGHGINVDGAMGSGIALQFRKKYPTMHETYVRMCREGKIIPGAVMFWDARWEEDEAHKEDRFIMNIASQDRPGRNADYAWLAQGVNQALDVCENFGLTKLALPRIGSGIGGLNEQGVEWVLWTLATTHNVDIELWTYSG